MKKIIALIVALVMCLSCTVAFAASPVIEGTFSFDTATFQNVFNMLAEKLELTYQWEAETRYDYGYPMYVCVNEDRTVAISLHENGGVFAFEVDSFVDMNATAEEAMAAGEEFGTAMGLLSLTVYMCEHGTVDATIQSEMNNCLVGLSELMMQMDSMTEEQMKQGVDYVVNVAEYPTCVQLTLQDTANGQQLWMAYMLLNATSSFAE